MRDEMDKWLGLAPGSRDPGRAWSPPVEVSERDGLLRIVLALPGMARDDLKVEVVNEGLLISGKPRSDGGQGAFRRCLALPPEAKTEEARARFEGGLLRITLPMAEPSSLRHEIPIEAGEPGAGERATPERDPERHMRAAV
jgi:HSP20 family molecular chaperone IbpA